MADTLLYTMILSYLKTLWPAALGFAIIAFWMRGYFNAYVKVRISRGKFTLAKEFYVDKIHYHVAEIKGGNLVWGKEGKAKDPQVILNNMEKDYMYREMNVDCVNIDGKTKSFLPPDLTAKNLQLIKQIQYDKNLTKEERFQLYKGIYNAIEGFDPEVIDSLIVAAKYKPSVLDNKMKLIIIGMIILLCVNLAVGFLVYQNNKAVNGLYADIQLIKSGVDTLKSVAPAIPIPTGGIH